MVAIVARAATQPSAPVISASALNATSASIALVTPSFEPTTGISGYLLFRRKSGQPFSLVALVSASFFPYTDLGLSTAQSYDYALVGVDNSSQRDASPLSNIASITTASTVSLIVSLTINPAIANLAQWTPLGQSAKATNFLLPQDAVNACGAGDHLRWYAVGASSRNAPYFYNTRVDWTGKAGTSSSPILVSVNPGDVVGLSSSFGYLPTSLPNGQSADPGKSLWHLENCSWIITDTRDQTNFALLDFSTPLDATQSWAMALGDRRIWLQAVQNQSLALLQRQFPYPHYATTNQINATKVILAGMQVNGAHSFTACFMARNCSWIDIRYCDIGAHGINLDQGNADMWPMQGDHTRQIDCNQGLCGHQNPSHEGTNPITRRLNTTGSWANVNTGGDFDTYAGGNISTGRIRKWNPNPFSVVGNVFVVPANFDPGCSLHEFNHYGATGKSATLAQGLPHLKLEGYNPRLRFCVADKHRPRGIGYSVTGSSSEPISSSTPFDSSAIVLHGRAWMYHNVGHNVNGLFLYEDSEFGQTWASGKKIDLKGQYIHVASSGFTYKASSSVTGTDGKAGTFPALCGSTAPSGSGTSFDGNITWSFIADHLLMHKNHGFGNALKNNIFDQCDDPYSSVANMFNQNLANSGCGRGDFPDNGKGLVIRNNLINYVGAGGSGKNFVIQCTGPADVVVYTSTLYGGRIGNNRQYVPQFVNVAALSSPLATVAIKGVILAPGNSDGLGTAEPLTTIAQSSTGTTLTFTDVGPFHDGMGWNGQDPHFPAEIPDTIVLQSANGLVRTTVQLAPSSRNLNANTCGALAPVAANQGDNVFICLPGSSTPLLNNGVG